MNPSFMIAQSLFIQYIMTICEVGAGLQALGVTLILSGQFRTFTAALRWPWRWPLLWQILRRGVGASKGVSI